LATPHREDGATLPAKPERRNRTGRGAILSSAL